MSILETAPAADAAVIAAAERIVTEAWDAEMFAAGVHALEAIETDGTDEILSIQRGTKANGSGDDLFPNLKDF